MKIIGITGISGSGTSTVAGLLTEKGGYYISADKLAHEAILPGKEAYHKIVEAFGAEILNKNNEIERKKLGAEVFGNPKQMALLESFIHPQVWADTELLLETARTGNAPFAIIDAPLLIESGMHSLCETVILVTASDTRRAERIMARDGITHESAARRLASRVSDDELAAYAHVVISNEGDLTDLREKLNELNL